MRKSDKDLIFTIVVSLIFGVIGWYFAEIILRLIFGG